LDIPVGGFSADACFIKLLGLDKPEFLAESGRFKGSLSFGVLVDSTGAYLGVAICDWGLGIVGFAFLVVLLFGVGTFRARGGVGQTLVELLVTFRTLGRGGVDATLRGCFIFITLGGVQTLEVV